MARDMARHMPTSGGEQPEARWSLAREISANLVRTELALISHIDARACGRRTLHAPAAGGIYDDCDAVDSAGDGGICGDVCSEVLLELAKVIQRGK